MDKKEKKIEALKARLKGLGHKLARGGKGTLIAGGTGVGLYYLEKVVDSNWGKGAAAESGKDEDNKLGEYQDMIVGAAYAAGGHFVKRKQYDAGTGMAAVGGYIFGRGMDHMMSKKKDGGTEADKAVAEATKASTSSTTVKGLVDAALADWSLPDAARSGLPSSSPTGSGAGLPSSSPTGTRALPARRQAVEWATEYADALVD